jgi:hypothetical protein
MAFLAGKRPSAAGVIAVGALVVAMSGTAVAASHQNGNKLIAKHTLSGNRLVNDTVGSAQLKNLVWHSLALQNGWVNYDPDNNYSGPVQFAKDAQGTLHLRGAISGDAATNDKFAVLPVGFRPVSPTIWLPVASTNNDSDPRTVAITAESSNGEMTAYKGQGANLSFVSLEGVSFAAA